MSVDVFTGRRESEVREREIDIRSNGWIDRWDREVVKKSASCFKIYTKLHRVKFIGKGV